MLYEGKSVQAINSRRSLDFGGCCSCIFRNPSLRRHRTIRTRLATLLLAPSNKVYARARARVLKNCPSRRRKQTRNTDEKGQDATVFYSPRLTATDVRLSFPVARFVRRASPIFAPPPPTFPHDSLTNPFRVRRDHAEILGVSLVSPRDKSEKRLLSLSSPLTLERSQRRTIVKLWALTKESQVTFSRRYNRPVAISKR